jgi:DNA repair photolyase
MKIIISASRRTDIPAYYSDWLLNRINEKFVLVQNPFNARQIRGIKLSPADLDCIVFWSKNPDPMINKLNALKDYAYYFQFTLNTYSSDVETNLPSKIKLIETFIKLSDKIGPEKVIWRYDPILLNDIYTINYHTDNFGEIAVKLHKYTEKVIFSFIDFYKKIESNIKALNIKAADIDNKNKIAENLSTIAKSNNLLIETCAEDIDLSKYGISRARCIDDRLISRITGRVIKAGKDKNQRLECGCAASVDIGAYNSCQNGCVYCYANYSQGVVTKNMREHDVFSPSLIASPSFMASP